MLIRNPVGACLVLALFCSNHQVASTSSEVSQLRTQIGVRDEVQMLSKKTGLSDRLSGRKLLQGGCKSGFSGTACDICEENDYTGACSTMCYSPESCTGHGRCKGITSACSCYEGWGGPDCSIDLTPTTSSTMMEPTTSSLTPEPTTEAPSTSSTAAPTTSSSTTVAPTTPNPTTAAPTTPEPTAAAPTTPEPTTEAPTTAEPTTIAPTTPEPTTDAPTTPTTVAPTTPDPTTAAPTTAAPTTPEPTTAAPTTADPTTVAPTTAAPTTLKPTTAAPTTPKPTTAAPTTAAPTTAAPTTPKPTTPAVTTTPKPTTPAAPTTAAPTTAAPTTAAPTTPEPTTAAPTTPEPTTAAPTTAAPTTPVPTTAAPTTAARTTPKPTTGAPTTATPTTPEPTTAAPTTPEPTTAAPTTPEPTTASPTTPKPTTAAPTTAAPTTEVPTPAPTTTVAPVWTTTVQQTTAAPAAPTTLAPTTTPEPTPADPTITVLDTAAADGSFSGFVTVQVVGGGYLSVTTDGTVPVCAGGSSLTEEVFLTASATVSAISCGPTLSSQVVSLSLAVTTTPTVTMHIVFGSLGALTQTQISDLEEAIASELNIDARRVIFGGVLVRRRLLASTVSVDILTSGASDAQAVAADANTKAQSIGSRVATAVGSGSVPSISANDGSEPPKQNAEVVRLTSSSAPDAVDGHYVGFVIVTAAGDANTNFVVMTADGSSPSCTNAAHKVTSLYLETTATVNAAACYTDGSASGATTRTFYMKGAMKVEVTLVFYEFSSVTITANMEARLLAHTATAMAGALVSPKQLKLDRAYSNPDVRGFYVYIQIQARTNAEAVALANAFVATVRTLNSYLYTDMSWRIYRLYSAWVQRYIPYVAPVVDLTPPPDDGTSATATTVGVAAGCAVVGLGGAGAFVYLRRKKQEDEEEADDAEALELDPLEMQAMALHPQQARSSLTEQAQQHVRLSDGAHITAGLEFTQQGSNPGATGSPHQFDRQAAGGFVVRSGDASPAPSAQAPTMPARAQREPQVVTGPNGERFVFIEDESEEDEPEAPAPVITVSSTPHTPPARSASEETLFVPQEEGGQIRQESSLPGLQEAVSPSGGGVTGRTITTLAV